MRNLIHNSHMDRYLEKFIIKDLSKKIVILTGPRQTGKTYLSRKIESAHEYLNYDYTEHRTIIREKSWDRNKKIIIFDELHKMKNWKSWIKGIYDVEGIKPHLLVTGSARLDTIKKTGDSLAGRFFNYRLHPVDIKEALAITSAEEALDRIMNVSGFPEPFLENNSTFYRRWKRSHIDIILRQDLLDLESVRDIKAIEILIDLLRARVGSPLSIASLARDLEKDPKTIRHYLAILENLYLIFPVRPYHHNIARAILKEPKYYFYDTAQLDGDEGIKLENLIACALVKELNFLEDTCGVRTALCYLRTKDGKELDFLVFIDKKPVCMIEVKTSDGNLSPNFALFEKYFKAIKKIQLVKNLSREKTFAHGAEIRDLVSWLSKIDLVSLDAG